MPLRVSRSAATPDARRRRARQHAGAWLPYAAAAPLIGLVAIVVYARSVDSASVFAVALLVAGAAFLAGALLGFLFGIPRSLAIEGSPAAEKPAANEEAPGAPRAPSYRSNTNLEQISDWLTKILVGVGLVELGKIVSETRKLVDFLAPALGDKPSSPSFALGLLFLYAISGFLIVYLVTRVYLGRIFAEADELMRYVDERIDEVRESQRAQEQRDVEALARVSRQLEPEGAAPQVTQEELNEAVAAASPLVRAQIFSRAREQRQRRDPEQTDRATGVFNALVEADKQNRYHRNHAQLAYALKDKSKPDLAGAVAELDKAIAIRDRNREPGFLLYELNRAVSRIEMDPKKGTDEPSDPELQRLIREDLQRASQSPYLRRQIAGEPAIKAWMKRNETAAAGKEDGR